MLEPAATGILRGHFTFAELAKELQADDLATPDYKHWEEFQGKYLR